MVDYTNGGIIPAVDNPCEFLPQLRAAHYQLLAGQARAQVRNDSQWVTYQRSDAKSLEREIRRLEIICGHDAHRGRAVQVGPHFPHHAHRRFRY
jgi:hypothetical protein